MKKTLLGFAFLLLFTMSFSYAKCQEPEIPIKTEVQLVGTASAPSGIKSLEWKQVSGPATPTIVLPNALTTLVKDYDTPGIYIYHFTVTDMANQTAMKVVRVTVLEAWGMPVADAKAEYIFRLPVKK